MVHWSRVTHREADFTVIWLPGGVQVGSGRITGSGGLWGQSGGHRKEQMPLDASLKSAANVILSFSRNDGARSAHCY